MFLLGELLVLANKHDSTSLFAILPEEIISLFLNDHACVVSSSVYKKFSDLGFFKAKAVAGAREEYSDRSAIALTGNMIRCPFNG